MMLDLLWALIAALIVTLVGVAFEKPRSIIKAWAHRLIWRAQMKLYLEHRENDRRAIERIASELTRRMCAEDGNPDDEYESELYSWFTGDPDANVDYEAKQKRIIERFGRGGLRANG
jgi:hypothetical protein